MQTAARSSLFCPQTQKLVPVASFLLPLLYSMYFSSIFSLFFSFFFFFFFFRRQMVQKRQQTQRRPLRPTRLRRRWRWPRSLRKRCRSKVRIHRSLSATGVGFSQLSEPVFVDDMHHKKTHINLSENSIELLTQLKLNFGNFLAASGSAF